MRTAMMRFEIPTALALEAAFDGGRLTSDGGICWLEKADSELDLCRLIADHAAECTSAGYTQA